MTGRSESSGTCCISSMQPLPCSIRSRRASHGRSVWTKCWRYCGSPVTTGVEPGLRERVAHRRDSYGGRLRGVPRGVGEEVAEDLHDAPPLGNRGGLASRSTGMPCRSLRTWKMLRAHSISAATSEGSARPRECPSRRAPRLVGR